MVNFYKSNTIGIIIFLLSAVSLLVGFYFNEDLSTGGAAADFEVTLNYKLALKEHLLLGITNSHLWTDEVPLHHLLTSRLLYLINDEYWLRFFFCNISILLPFLFYLNLKNKLNNLNQNTILIFSSLIFILPSFRYSAIWANSNITALIFLLLSTFFFIRWEKSNNYNQLNLNLILQTIFLSCAVYCRMEYSVIFLYFMIIYFQKLDIKTFLKISTIVLIFSLPGFLMIYNIYNISSELSTAHPMTFSSLFSLERFDDGILVNSSIISFYLIPIFFFTLLNNKIFFLIKNKYTLLIAIIFSLAIVYLLSLSFNYNHKVGGGFFLKLSIFIFKNNFLFYLTSVIGLLLIIYLGLENKNNFIFLVILLIGFSGYSYSFQKYFEPLFLIVFFLLINSKISYEFLKNYKNLLHLYLYIFAYFISAIINVTFQISKNI